MTSPMVPEGLRVFLRHAKSLHPSNNARGENGFAKEFQRLKELSSQLKRDKVYSSQHGELDYNRPKNRYKDILPYDYSRIVLPLVCGVQGSDYINGNYIKGPDDQISYLAVQGPLPRTVDDFWRLISSHRIQVVVMVCKEIELGKLKCKRYWPDSKDEILHFAGLEISLISKDDNNNGFITRTIRMTSSKEELTITQLHYTAWPDHDIPESAQPLIELNKTLRNLVGNQEQKVLVHCSAGCGRTGTICAVDYAWGLLKMQKTDGFSVFDIVASLRRQRMAMVQTKEQYELVYKAVEQLVQEEINRKKFESHTYVNVEPVNRPPCQSPTGRGEYENCKFVNSVSYRTKGEDTINTAGSKPLVPIPVQKKPELKQKTSESNVIAPSSKPVLGKSQTNQEYGPPLTGTKSLSTSHTGDSGNKLTGSSGQTALFKGTGHTKNISSVARNGVDSASSFAKGTVTAPNEDEKSPTTATYEVLASNAMKWKMLSNENVTQRHSDYEIPPLSQNIGKKNVPEGLLIDHMADVPSLPIKRHSVDSLCKGKQGSGNIEGPTKPHGNAQRSPSNPNILDSTFLSTSGRMQDGPNDSPWDMLCRKTNENVGFHTLPSRMDPVSAPRRKPLTAGLFENPGTSGGGLKVLNPAKEPKGQYVLFGAVNSYLPGSGDQGVGKAAQLEQGKAPLKAMPAKTEHRSPQPRRTVDKPNARSPVGTYSLVRIPEGGGNDAMSSKTPEVEANGNLDADPLYNLVGQWKPTERRVSAPPPYSGNGVLHAVSDSRSQAGLLSSVQNSALKDGRQNSGRKLEKELQQHHGVNTPDISLPSQRSGEVADLRLVQDLYATVVPKVKDKKDSKGVGSSTDALSESAVLCSGSSKSLGSHTSSGSLQSFTSVSSDDLEEDVPAVPEKTNDAFFAPGEEPYENMEQTDRGTLDRFKRMMKSSSKSSLLNRRSEQPPPPAHQRGLRNSSSVSVNFPLEDLGYLKRVSKPFGPRSCPKHWPSFAHLGL